MTATAPQTSISLRVLLEEMIQRDASDLHVSVGECAKLRIDGEMASSNNKHVMDQKDTKQLAYTVLTEEQKKRFELEAELDFSFGVQNLARFRGNCFRQRGCVSMVVRQIPFAIRSFADRGLSPAIAKMAE
jgi:twitching motility protein PilT